MDSLVGYVVIYKYGIELKLSVKLEIKPIVFILNSFSWYF